MIYLKQFPLNFLKTKIYNDCMLSLFSTIKNKKSTYTNTRNIKGDITLKNYFNKRSQMQHTDFIQILQQIQTIKVSKSFFNDQRWIHLNILIQKNLTFFTTKQQFKILNCLTKMRNFNDLFLTIHATLCNKLVELTINQKAYLIYYLAKSKKSKPQIFKSISDSLISSLKQTGVKFFFGKQAKQIEKSSDKIEKIEKIDEQQIQQQQSQSLFEQIQKQNQIIQTQTVDCRLLILCLWSLHQMKIKDDLLSNLITKQLIKPNLASLSTELFPLLLSTLWVSKMHNKRLFQEITKLLIDRQQQLLKLDKDKLKMLICVLCKPQISKANFPHQQQQKLTQMRKKLVLWLMQTLILQHQNKQIFLLSTSAYRIISNAYNANFHDGVLFVRYIRVIAQDLSKIQMRQVIYLLAILRNLRRNRRAFHISKQQFQKDICQKQYQILCQRISKKILSFLHQTNQQHSARVTLRQLVVSNFIEVPKTIRKNLLYEQKQSLIKRHTKGEKQYKEESGQKIKTKKNQQKDQKTSKEKNNI